ncbi:MAG TPA: hypothetical protein VEM58_11335 [Streptosporangiaceae bacterium]|nr:hypothetical protein [Streptosporangiaceae bacterium]
MHRQGRILAALCTALAAAVSVASCATSTPSGSGQPGSGTHGSGQPGSGAGQSGSAPASPTQSCTAGWRTGSLTVTRQVTVPPVPVATAVRTGSHPDCRFDRLVIDINRAVPGYSVSFVGKVTQGASGHTITMPGTKYLVITLKPAQGHSAAGTVTLPAGVQPVSDPMLKAWTVSGDFEGVLSVALGLVGGSRYRVGELGSRIYVDVAW